MSARIKPSTYLNFLVSNYALIDAVFEHTQDGPVPPTALASLVRACGLEPSIVTQLEKYNIIQQIPGSTRYEMSDFVKGILSHLKQEHQLGLSETIKVYIEDLQYQLKKIRTALKEGDYPALNDHRNRLEQSIKRINRDINNNELAVDNLVTSAKLRKEESSLKQRYYQVFEAWDRYVEPLAEMININGPFEAMFETLETELRSSIRTVSGSGILVSERENFERLLHRLISLRSDMHDHFSRIQGRLLPLVESARKNSAVARGAAIALKALKEHGTKVLTTFECPDVLTYPLDIFSGDDAVEAYLVGLRSFEPGEPDFPEPPEERRFFKPPLDIDEVLAKLNTLLPVDDVFLWLVDNYDRECEINELLDIYFMITRDDKQYELQREQRKRYETSTHIVTAPAFSIRKKEA